MALLGVFQELSGSSLVRDLLKLTPLAANIITAGGPVPSPNTLPLNSQISRATIIIQLDEETIDNFVKNVDKLESRFEIFLRVGKTNQHGTEIVDFFPTSFRIAINDLQCPLPPLKNASKGCAIDITPYIYKTNGFSTGIIAHLSWSQNYDDSYGCAIQLVRRYRRSTSCLLDRLNLQPELSSSLVRKRIQQDFENSSDEMVLTSMKVSLICPLGKMLISLPARGAACAHLQCFDATFYIEYNKVKGTWKCPICYKSCPRRDLLVDGYFIDVLDSDLFDKSVPEIELQPDGCWVPARQAQGRVPIVQVVQNEKNVLFVDLTD